MEGKKTHLVIDLIITTDISNEVFAGTYEECLEWKHSQGFGYQIRPMTKEEIEIHNV